MRSLILISALAVPLLASTTLAQDNPAPATNDQTVQSDSTQANPATPNTGGVKSPVSPDSAEPAAPAMSDNGQAASTDKVMVAQDQSEVRGSWITGTVVRSSTTGEDVGAIEDFLIDTSSDTITGAVISVGGFLGIGAKSIVVDWKRLTIDYDGYQITTDLTKEEADAAPAYEFRDRQQPPPPAPNPADSTEPAVPGATPPATPPMEPAAPAGS